MVDSAAARRRCYRQCGRIACFVSLLAACLSTLREVGFVGNAKITSAGASSELIPRRAGPEPFKPFSNDKLRAETEEPFAKAKIALFGFGAALSGVGFLFIVPRLIGSLAGAPRAAPVGSVATDLAINLVATLSLAYLTYQEINTETVRVQAKEEGSLIARLPLQLEGGTFKISDFRALRQQRARRPVLCIGSRDFCMECIESSLPVSEAMDRSDFLLVPVLSGSSSEAERASILEAANKHKCVALPGKDREGSWEQLCQLQEEQVRQQGMDEGQGQVMIIKKNGRVGARFVGVPDWSSLTSEVAARTRIGLDTTNI
eukprot:gb/GFBE01079471.1/.p1 GENE.gb/GFBE01079471.1/~~gb/GFBE01079471.1/.p1  ORF type:complete len:317 (+),score=61.31 gb/GFBE01079471.1/:1-951(+)